MGNLRVNLANFPFIKNYNSNESFYLWGTSHSYHQDVIRYKETNIEYCQAYDKKIKSLCIQGSSWSDFQETSIRLHSHLKHIQLVTCSALLRASCHQGLNGPEFRTRSGTTSLANEAGPGQNCVRTWFCHHGLAWLPITTQAYY